MRSAVLAAALLALPGAALADAQGTIQLGQTGVRTTFDAPGSVTYDVRLTAGLDYAVETSGDPGDGYAQVRDAGGNILAKTPFNSLDQLGMTFRSGYSGDFFVTVVDQSADPAYGEDRVWIAVDTDCAAARRTLCTLPIGTTRSGKLFNYKGDVDWYRTHLRGGATYAIHLAITDGQSPPVSLRVRDDDGRVLTPRAGGDGPSADLIFRAPATATGQDCRPPQWR